MVSGTGSEGRHVVHIRRAVPDDAAQVFPLAHAMATTFEVDEVAFQSSFAQVVARDDAMVLVAETDGYIVGYLLGFDHLAFYANGRVSYVEEVAVDETCRGHGIGRDLMSEFEALARHRDSMLVTVATRRAAGFYQSLGYEVTADLFRKLF